MSGSPAGAPLLGAEPAFPDGIAFARPPAPPLARVVARLTPSYDAGILTNGPLVRELEAAVAERLGVAHALALSSCTAGLMLALRAVGLGRPGGDRRPVVVPSFTFSATAHAVAWNGHDPRFAECEAGSFQLDCADAAARLDGVGGLVATHVFGAPCAAERVETLGREAGIPVVFDAAHAFGAKRGARPVGGFGDAEVFSLSPTKPMTAAEGGLVTTDRDDIAAAVRIGRDYGNPGDYDTRFPGLNARMSELHAAVALESLVELDAHLDTRRSLANRYADGLEDVPGIEVQHVDAGDDSTWKDLTIAVDGDAYGMHRDTLVALLRAEGVDTRNYFDPPVHRQRAYRHLGDESPEGSLPVTERVAASVVSIPLYRELGERTIDRIVELLTVAHAQADRIRG